MPKLLLIVLMSLSGLAYAVPCDISVSEQVVSRTRNFRHEYSVHANHFSLTGSEDVARAEALARCSNEMGASANCVEVSTSCSTTVHRAHCISNVTGTLYRQRSPRDVRAEKCAKIDRCIENSSLTDNVDAVRVYSTLRFDLNCQ